MNNAEFRQRAHAGLSRFARHGECVPEDCPAVTEMRALLGAGAADTIDGLPLCPPVLPRGMLTRVGDAVPMPGMPFEQDTMTHVDVRPAEGYPRCICATDPAGACPGNVCKGPRCNGYGRTHGSETKCLECESR